MKLVFEWDIPELQGKSWREKMALRRQARSINTRISIRSALLQSVFAPWMILLFYLWVHQVLQSWLVALALYLAVALSVGILLDALWVNPLLAQALRSTKA